ncbi:MAG TPA: hypothetical protein VHS31_01880 [Tepidisphaeraceae bacterium]|jgi:hypothetical protein|nr:hypothetical protein [Tepidisphaeraceae bacterium]
MATPVAKAPVKKRATLRQRLEKAGPSSAKLKQLAKTRRPPQKWYDDATNPFKKSK